MELRHLRYFATVAEERHFGRAARRLGIAQPPLSRQIQALEAEVGCLLFDRSTRRVELTAAGHVLLERVGRVFDTVEQAIAATRRAGVGETGRVVLGYVSSLAMVGIPELLRGFRARHPDVELALRQMSPHDQVEALKDGRIDVGFLRGPMADDALSLHLVRREPMVLAVSSRHPLARRRRIALGDLVDEPFLMFPRGRNPGLYELLMQVCHAAGFTPKIAQEAPLFDMVNMVIAGFGISIVPESLRNMKRRGLALRPVIGVPTSELLLAHRAADDSPALHRFLAYAMKHRLR